MGDIFLGKGEQAVHLLGRLGNRHGLIAGATGTGKTVTLQVLAEAFAREGVNVFAADIKGDLSGCAGVDPLVRRSRRLPPYPRQRPPV